jgi:hypothetical protein
LIVLYEWVLGNRHTHCDRCVAMAGTVGPAGSFFPSPGFHHGCGCSLVAILIIEDPTPTVEPPERLNRWERQEREQELQDTNRGAVVGGGAQSPGVGGAPVPWSGGGDLPGFGGGGGSSGFGYDANPFSHWSGGGQTPGLGGGGGSSGFGFDPKATEWSGGGAFGGFGGGGGSSGFGYNASAYLVGTASADVGNPNAGEIHEATDRGSRDDPKPTVSADDIAGARVDYIEERISRYDLG